MNLITGHVMVVTCISICVTVLGMGHVLSGDLVSNVFIGGLASFAAHGAVSTVKNGNGK